jgi:serpin B
MMGMKSTVRYYADESLAAVDLPYGRGNYCMTVILPSYPLSTDSLVSLLTNEKWDRITGGFTETEVNVFLPRFRIEFEKELKDPLSRLGMEIAFDPFRADFHKINPDMVRNLYISSVKHKTFVETDEEGTEAAAVTSVTICELSATPGQPPVVTFRADHPFLFIIREQTTGAILFMGKVSEPNVEF